MQFVHYALIVLVTAASSFHPALGAFLKQKSWRSVTQVLDSQSVKNTTLRASAPDFCDCPSRTDAVVNSRNSKFNDVAFIVVLNSPYWKVLPLLADVYAPHTSKLLFCSKHTPPAELPSGTGFLQVQDMGGVMDGDNVQYECLRRALLDDRFPSVNIKGFAVVADDAFIDFKHLAAQLDLSTLGMYTSDPIHQVYSLLRPQQDGGSLCKTWGNLIPYGYPAAQATYNELQQIMQTAPNGAAWSSPYVKNMAAKEFKWNHCDFFYLPAKLREPYVQLSSVFAKHKVYFELALPTMWRLFSQVHNTTITDIRGFSVNPQPQAGWKGQRAEFWKNPDILATSGTTWLHPVKLSWVEQNMQAEDHTEARNFFCQTMLQCGAQKVPIK